MDGRNLECCVCNPIIWMAWVFLQLLTLGSSVGTTGDEQFSEHWENIDNFTVLAQEVTGIVFRLDPMETNNLHSYGFPDPVECQNVVPLAQSGMRKGSTCNNRPVITKHMDFELMGTPRYFNVYLRSIFCSVIVLAATNSEPYGALLKTRMKPSSSSNSAPAMMNSFS